MNTQQAGFLAAAIYPPFSGGSFLQVWQSDTVTCGYCLDADGRKTFAFAGSHDVRDFIDDALAIPVKIPRLGGNVHAGFAEGMLDMFDRNLRQLIKPGDTVNALGHSLGAPHAGYFTALCKGVGVRIGTLATFESPRPGYVNHCAYVRENCDEILSFKNARDPIVKLPPRDLLFPWAHYVGQYDLNYPAASDDPFEDHLMVNVLKGLSMMK